MQGVSVSGDLRVFPVANVLQFLASSRVTGALRLWHGMDRAFLWLENGDIVAASILTPSSDERCAHVSRAASRSELEELLSAHVSKVLAAVLTWPEGQFALVTEVASVRSDGSLPRINVERALMTAAWVADEERRAS